MIENEKRNMINIETMRSTSVLGLRYSELSPQDAGRLKIRSQMNFENLISQFKSLRNIMKTDKTLESMKTGAK